MEDNNQFLPQVGFYRRLVAFQKAECVYDVTFYFATHHLSKGDRTVDQMVQAARSGKQNIAEGSAAAPTSKETQIKLLNVAKASLQELLIDYEDYLRNHGFELWDRHSPQALQAMTYCRAHNDSADYRQKIPLRSPQTIANIAITLIHQTDCLLHNLIERCKRDFLAKGGIREEMTRARLAARNGQPSGGRS